LSQNYNGGIWRFGKSGKIEAEGTGEFIKTEFALKTDEWFNIRYRYDGLNNWWLTAARNLKGDKISEVATNPYLNKYRWQYG